MSTEEQLSQIKGVDSVKTFYENNKKNINIASIVFIVLLGAVYYYFKYYQPGREAEAQGQLFTAERYFRQDSLNLALNGDGLHPGTREIADDYSSTDAGNLASYYTGVILLRNKSFEEALDYFNNCSFSDEIMSAAVISLKGDCYSELGDYEKAASHYMKAANKRENTITGPIALQKAAIAFEASENYEEALEAIEQLKEQYSESEPARGIDKLKGRIEAKLLAKK